MQVQKDRKWLVENYALLKQKFRDKYIAVKNEDVVDSDISPINLTQRIAKKYEKNHRTVIIECMSDHMCTND
jgi:hypothetical protein